jgi:hypothetical protein
MPEQDKQIFDFWGLIRERVVPSLIVAICGGMFLTYVKVVQLGDSMETTKRDLTALTAKVASIEDAYVKRTELLEIMKRIEQQQELILLKAKVDRTENRSK